MLKDTFMIHMKLYRTYDHEKHLLFCVSLDCSQTRLILTLVSGHQVDGLGQDGAQWRRHLQPQLVAVHAQVLYGARLPEADLVAGPFVLGFVLLHLPPRPSPLLLLLHLIALYVSPPAGRSKQSSHVLTGC